MQRFREERGPIRLLRTLHFAARAKWLVITLAWLMCAHVASASPPPSILDQLAAGAIEVPIENLEGVVLVRATLRGPSGRDTTGLLVVDTGAGFLGVDDGLDRDNPEGRGAMAHLCKLPV